MDISRLVSSLDNPQNASEWFRSLGIEDVERAHANLVSIAQGGITLDLLAVICDNWK